jgi:uncharacterized protein with FMN-binding domain
VQAYGIDGDAATTVTEPTPVKPVKHNLVALGSATVLAVYAAGYLRTRSAADRFMADDSGRRLVVATTEHAPSPQPSSVTTNEPVAVEHRDTPSVAATVAAPAAKEAGRRKTPDATATAIPAPETTPASGAGAGAGDSSAQVPEKERGSFKDGNFSGWGTSRHGDIEATVEIKDGRIVSAVISQCYTRYSCSWIAALPPQVVARQSANVDFVSGATQSTNAFYYAVVEALAKAK